MTTQLEMKFTRQEQAKQDVATLLAMLAHGKWQTGKVLRACADWREDRLRHAAEAAGGQVVSGPGCSLGYRLASACPVEEYLEQVDRRYRSQMRKMGARLIAMRRAVHKGKV